MTELEPSSIGRSTDHRVQEFDPHHGVGYSAGLAQINSRNFARLGLTSTSAFDSCSNLQAMQVVLGECMLRSHGPPQIALSHALSCYYSGDPESGFRDGYVARVLAVARIRCDEVAPASRDVNYRGIP